MRTSRSDCVLLDVGTVGEVGVVAEVSEDSAGSAVLERLRGGCTRAGALYTVPIGIFVVNVETDDAVQMWMGRFLYACVRVWGDGDRGGKRSPPRLMCALMW